MTKYWFSDQLYDCNVYDLLSAYDLLKRHQTPFENIEKQNPVCLIFQCDECAIKIMEDSYGHRIKKNKEIT